MIVQFTHELLCNREHVSLTKVHEVSFVGKRCLIYLIGYKRPLVYHFDNMTNLRIYYE